MLKVALRGLLVHKARLLLTFGAVALGVAFVGGVLVLTDTMNRTFDDLFADIFRDTDAVVRSAETIGDDFGEVRAQVDAEVLDQVRAADGVAGAEGEVGGFARVIDKEGEAVGDPLMGAPTLGGNWTEVDELNPFDIVDGRPPRGAGEIVMDRGTAGDTGYEVGDTVTVQTRDLADEYELVGIVRFGTTDSPGGATYVLWETEAAQRLLGEEGRFGAVSAVAEDGVSQSELAASIERALDRSASDRLEVLTGEQITEETQNDIKEQLGFLTQFFLVFAIIAVFVGTFVIYNSFAIIVAQRTREMALLRAIGARRRQVRRAVVIEAAVIGLAGAVIGFLGGLGLAALLSSVLQLPSGTLAVLPTAVITALLTGLIVTVVSALVPAWRAGRVPPLAAMRDVAVDTGGRSRIRVAIGLVGLALGTAALVSGAFDGELAVVGIGAALLFLGLLLVSPGLARPVSRLLGAPLARLRGASGRLARENAGRNPKRTSATAQALMIGVGLVAFILVVNASIRASIDEALEESFSGDFVVTGGSFGMVGLPPELAEQIGELPEVEAAAPVRWLPAHVDGDETAVGAANEAGFDMLDLRIVEGNAALGPGEVVVTEDEARSAGLRIGDHVDVSFLDDRRPESAQFATVAGIYDDSTAAGGIGAYVVSLADVTAAVPTSTDTQVFVQLAEGVSVADAQSEIERIVEPFPTAEVLSVEEYKDTIGAQLDSLLVLLAVLLFLSLVIALLGIWNTIALSVFERTRELGLLRAVGMRRRQLRAAVRWESVIISLFGTVLGLAFGLAGGWGIVRALRDEGFGAFRVPVPALVVVSLVAGLLGMAAALFPAWRAGRMNVLEAIAHE